MSIDCWTVGSSCAVKSELNMNACCIASLVVTPMMDEIYNDAVGLSLFGLVIRSGICATFWNLIVV